MEKKEKKGIETEKSKKKKGTERKGQGWGRFRFVSMQTVRTGMRVPLEHTYVR